MRMGSLEGGVKLAIRWRQRVVTGGQVMIEKEVAVLDVEVAFGEDGSLRGPDG
jgi:hypothetical protein